MAQDKLEDYLYQAAVFLGRPGNTLADWAKMQQEQTQAEDSEFDALWGDDQ